MNDDTGPPTPRGVDIRVVIVDRDDRTDDGEPTYHDATLSLTMAEAARMDTPDLRDRVTMAADAAIRAWRTTDDTDP